MGIVCQLYFSNSPTVFYLLGGKGNNLSRKLKLGRRIERCWVVLTWVLGKAVGPWEKWQAHNFFRAFFICIYICVCIWEQWQAHNFFCTILYLHNGPCVFSNLSTMPKFMVRNECAKWRSHEYFLPRNLLRCQCWVFCAFLCLPKLDLFPLKLNCLNIHSFWLGRLMCSLCDCLW